MKRVLIGLLFTVFICRFTLAQEDPALRQLLRGKTNLTDVMKVVEEYYNDPATMSRLGTTLATRKYKHWKRWEWYMSSRLDANGEFVNINQKMMQATGIEQNRQLRSANGRESAVESVNGSWAAVGPVNTDAGIGRVDRLAFHPTDPDIVYAGSTAGGLWRTTNGGTSWTNLTANVSSNGISGIALDPTDTDIIYVLTGDGDSNISGLVEDFGYMRFSIGVLKSTDGGTHWTKLPDFPGTTSTLVGYRLTIHPTDPDVLIACTSQGLFRTRNGGNTWVAEETTGGRFQNMKFKPGSNSVGYAISLDTGPFSRFWVTSDTGNTWTQSNTINTQINTPTSRVELAVAASNSNVVYLLCGGIPGNGQYKGLFRSGNSGVSFTLQSNTPNILGRANDGSDNASQSAYDLALAVSTATSATVVTGGVEVWRSLDAGVGWDFRGGLHDDVHDLGFHPADNTLWAATDGGVYSSTDNGANWTSHFNGMNITQFYRMAVSPANYFDMIGGAQDNGIKKRNAGTFFDNIAGADGYCVGYDPGNTSVYYAIRNNSLTRFTNDGANANNVLNGLRFFTNMAMHTSLGGTVFLASDTFRTVFNNGNSVTNYVAASMPRGGWYLQTCPSNGNRIYMAGGTCATPSASNPAPGCYAASTGVLRRSDDGGLTWPTANILSNNTGFPLSYPKITCINVDPTNSLRVWVTFGGFNADVKVYYSNDGGDNWFDRSGSLPNLPVNCIVLDNNNNAYIGTDNGVYYRSTTMSDWVPFYNNLPYVPVTDLLISQDNNIIRAATFGRGIWSSDLYSDCVANVVLAGTLEGQEFYEASNSVSSTSLLLTSEGTKVQMRGGIEVHLEPGFTARESTHFRAMIGPCGSGGVAGFRTITDSSRLLPGAFIMTPDNRKAMVHVQAVATGLQTIITVEEKGDIQFELSDAAGNRIQHWDKMSFNRGVTEKTLPVNNNLLRPGLYYLHLVHNGIWQHMQEWEVK
jgi:hypothetical protein